MRAKWILRVIDLIVIVSLIGVVRWSFGAQVLEPVDPAVSTGDASATSGAPTGAVDELLNDAATVAEDGPASDGPSAEPAGDWLYAQRTNGKGRISRGAYARALVQARALAKRTADVDPALAEAPWEAMGPTNVGGRVVEVAVDPTRQTLSANQYRFNSVVYAATASGGVWRSATAGTTWTYAWNKDITQSMGALAVGSDGVVYAGTGEANPGGGSIVWGGDGMYRSTDSGATWEHIGLATSGAFGRIVVDPADPKRVFAAAAGDLFVPGGERGLYRSEDGGDTWERVLAGENDTTGAIDVAVDPQDPDNMLVAMWDHVRLPTHRMYAGVGSGVWRSTDGGDTWTEVTFPGNVAPQQVGRIGVAFAPSNPQRAYAVVANRLNGTGVGLWRSDDGGATWTKTAAGSAAGDINGGTLSQSSYGWWFGKVWVDPDDPARVFVAGLELIESTNGGDTFVTHGNTLVGVATGTNVVLPHADQHGMAWDPYIPNRVYLANDGGVYRSDADARTGTWQWGAQQGWTQHYSVSVSQQNPNRVASGMQDNMCQRNYVGGNVGHPSTWTKYGLCGDGLQTLINPVDDRVVYGCAQYGGNCSRTVDGGQAFVLLGSMTARYGWWAPLVFDPNDPNVMYKGGNVVGKSTNAGDSWTVISPDLTKNQPQLDPHSGYRIYHTITTIAVAKTDPNVLYVGTDDGLLWRTGNGGQSWEQLSDGDDENDLPGLWVTRLAVDPTDANVVYATFSGFRNGGDAAHVVRSADGGATWTNISGDLPSAPVNDVVVLGAERLAVGTDVGVFLTNDGGDTWLKVGTGLAVVPIPDIEYHAPSNTIYAATFGQGIQRVTLSS